MGELKKQSTVGRALYLAVQYDVYIGFWSVKQ